MDFQSSVLRDGQWVTETVNLQDALKASAAPKPTLEPRREPPNCGILSKTVVESPCVHWVLRARLRSETLNDVAFIGDHYVQISEMREDGQLHEVARKSDFDCRIRNAIVLGADRADNSDDPYLGFTRGEDGYSSSQSDFQPQDTENIQRLPPQLLVLMLESGDCIFLFVRERQNGALEFITTMYRSPKNLRFLGFHLSADPTFRYMVAASSEGAFVLYELESMQTMRNQYLRQGSLNPVIAMRIRTVKGVIHKMDFLYPRPEDDYHVILLLILIRRERVRQGYVTRMVTYDWELGDDLHTVFNVEKIGTRLSDEHKMPLLVIPLRFCACFFVVSEHFIGIVKEVLSGAPNFELIQPNNYPRTSIHHGASDPLWTAWARPFRTNKYFSQHDSIYLAREDGVIIYLDTESDLVPSVSVAGTINTNISTAFTTAWDRFKDVLIIGGDSGPGGVWKLAPRQVPKQASTIPNWSPVIDMATTDVRSSWAPEIPAGETSARRRALTSQRKPDRIFCTSGRGPRSAVTEIRMGIQARVGLELDYDHPVRQSWMFPTIIHDETSFYALLSLPNSSDVLQFSSNLDNASVISPEESPFDLESRTIYAAQDKQETIIQITETSITLIAISQSSRYRYDREPELQSKTADTACANGSVAAVSFYSDQSSQIHVLRVDQMAISPANLWDARGGVTCMDLVTISENTFIVMGLMNNNLPAIAVYSLEGKEIIHYNVATTANEADNASDQTQIEAFTSIAFFDLRIDNVGIALGTRSGHVATGELSLVGSPTLRVSIERLGMAPSNLFPVSADFGGDAAVLACCDGNLAMMTKFSPRSNTFKTKNFIWPTDTNDPSLPSPTIHSAYCLANSLSGYRGHLSLVLLAGSQILLAEVWPHVGPVPRSIPLDGSPMRLIYSQTWKCLVVAHAHDNRPTLSFIDPDSGATISSAADKDRNPSQYISGLGHPGDKIFGLFEWLYVKDGRTFPFIIVTTLQGRLMIVSAEMEHGSGPDRRLRYWTRAKKKGFGEPIYSVVGAAEGLFFCVGDVLHWEILDLAEKKLKAMKQFTLDSPATSLTVVDGKVCALTASNSMQVVDLHAESPTTDMSLIHSDQVTRYTGHTIMMGDTTDGPGTWPINLISTSYGGIAGVWIPWGQRNRELCVTFEGTLPTSVRRFRRGKTRPLWASPGRQRRYGSLLSTVDGAEILGVSLDGSLQHFTLLSMELWRVLRLIQNLAGHSPVTSSVTSIQPPPSDMDMDVDIDLENELRPQPDKMHVDGDILRRCLDLRVLEDICSIGDGIDLLCEYLDGIDDGIHTEGFREDEDGDDWKTKYLDLGYDILEYLLAPVI